MTAPFPNIRCVFLDRDGVLNRKPPEGAYIRNWEEFHLLPGVAAAVSALNRSGRTVIVVSNQRGIALGLYTRAGVDAIHARLAERLAADGARIDAFYICPHDKDECDCRKPKTGLFEQAFRDFPEMNPSNSLLIGDSISDIQAARTLGIPSVFIDGDPQTQKAGAAEAAALADARAASFAEAVERFLP
ncbi:MAG TPA: HAD family hydrolase [Acidobacteriaceae bacterium]|nr:HAD family hydrolase [Acidobacteriaceae bacterium]